MSEMTSRERIRTTLQRQEPDRVPRVEICFWPQTVARWREEGLPEGQDPTSYFDLDVIAMTGFDCSLQLAPELLEETEEWKIERDRDGTVHKSWKTSYAPPCELDHLIKSRADWERYRDRLLSLEGRGADNVPGAVAEAHRRGRFVTLNPTEPVWWVLRTLGMERALITMAEDPGWFEDMVTVQAELSYALARQVIESAERPDAIWFFSDLCYRNGMLFSPRSYRELMQRHHRPIADLCHDHDMFLILHCDGDVSEFIPLLIETGFDAVQPLEARAGNDVRMLKPLFGDRITLFGNMNMDVFAEGSRNMVHEEVVTKLEAAMPGGGYIYHSDHSVPPTVSFETYRYAQELVRQYGVYR